MHKAHKELQMLVLLFATLLTAGGGLAQNAPPTTAAKVLFVRCGKLIFDTDKAPLSPASVIITDGKITAVGANLAPPAGAQQVDWSGFTVLPGLLDAHMHLWIGPRLYDQPSTALMTLRAQTGLQDAVTRGIAAVRVVGSPDFIDVALSQAAEDGTFLGPHLVPAGQAITTPGGHGDFISFPPQLPLADYYTPLHGFINSPEDAEKAVHLQLKYGARVIKVLASGGVISPLDSPTAEQLSPEELRVIVQQAHMAHVKVAAHAENIRSIMASLEAGVDSIEHGSDLNQQAIDFMKQHHVILDPTLFVVENFLHMGEQLHLPEYSMRKARELAKITYPSFDMALKAGVTMAAGSDQLYQRGGTTVLDEIVALVHHGMTPQQALTAATKTNAALMGFADLGTVENGKEGDLVAIDGDPLGDVTAVKRTKGVVFRGSVVPMAVP
jgi:imidazolonepropionase-like amidohydrolase